VTAMRLKSDFLVPITHFRTRVANDNLAGDADCRIRTRVTAQLTAILARAMCDEGVT
jgi:hypothetical protein